MAQQNNSLLQSVWSMALSAMMVECERFIYLLITRGKKYVNIDNFTIYGIFSIFFLTSPFRNFSRPSTETSGSNLRLRPVKSRRSVSSLNRSNLRCSLRWITWPEKKWKGKVEEKNGRRDNKRKRKGRSTKKGIPPKSLKVRCLKFEGSKEERGLKGMCELHLCSMVQGC